MVTVHLPWLVTRPQYIAVQWSCLVGCTSSAQSVTTPPAMMSGPLTSPQKSGSLRQQLGIHHCQGTPPRCLTFKAVMFRYGQSQIVLSPDHLLVMGGCGGPNNEYADIWMLNMEAIPWTWVQMEVSFLSTLHGCDSKLSHHSLPLS